MTARLARFRPAFGWLGRHFTPIAAVAVVVGVAVAVWGQREAIRSFDWHLPPHLLALSIALFAIAPVVQGVCFWLVLRLLHVPSRADEALAVWMRSFLARYAPTGALAIVVRVRASDRLTTTRGYVLTATAYEQLVAAVSGALVAVAAFALAGGRVPRPVLLLGLGTLAVAVAIRPRFLGEPARRLLARRGREVPALLRGRRLAAVIAINMTGWVATGAGAWVLVDALTGGDAPNAAWLLGALAFAQVVGFLLPILPGGLGIREATLIGFLAVPFTGGVATTIALGLRLVGTLGEFLAIGAVEIAYRLRKRATPELWAELRRGRAANPE